MTGRGDWREDVFWENRDRQMFLQLLEATCAKTRQVPAGVNRNERDPLLPTNFILPPVTGDPYPASRPAHPVAFHPPRPWTWTGNPGAGNPLVACSGPAPVTACPSVSRPRRDGLRFNPNRWRSLGDQDLSRDRPRDRARRGDFLSSCRRRHRRWFLGAAGQQNRCQRGYVKTCSHVNSLLMDSVYSGGSALFSLLQSQAGLFIVAMVAGRCC